MKNGLKSGLLLALAGLTSVCGGCTRQIAHTQPLVRAGWQMGTSVNPTALRQLDPAQFRVVITGAYGTPVSGADVKISLAMPEMDMGRNEVTAHMSALGIYTAADRFTMPGRWIVTVRATQGALYQSASFPVTVQQ